MGECPAEGAAGDREQELKEERERRKVDARYWISGRGRSKTRVEERHCRQV